jgi:Tol biopolymer transport system component
VSVRGGEPLTLCNVAYLSGASWGADDTIIFGARTSGLMRVPAGGGQPDVIRAPDVNVGPEYASHPQILPDGKSVVFTIVTEEAARIESLSLDTGERRVLLRGSTGLRQAHYLPTDHMVYAQSGELMAVNFGRARSVEDHPSFSVLDNLFTSALFGTAYFTISDTGSLVYVSGRQAESRLVWVDREGQETPLADETGDFGVPRLSPDGSQAAFNTFSAQDSDIWVFDVERKTRRRLTFGGGFFPVWTPDGKRITYSYDENLYWIPADGSGEAELLLIREHNQSPFSWSPDGKLLAFSENNPDTRRDIWVLPLEGDRIPVPVLTTESNEHSPMFSPDGRWLAYISDESGRQEVYIQSYPGPGTKHLISREGGREPVWSADGRELFYRYGHQVFAVPIETEPALIAGTPELLFEKQHPAGKVAGAANFYDVAPDGRRFVMTTMEQESEPVRFHVVLNWFDELERLVPTK